MLGGNGLQTVSWKTGTGHNDTTCSPWRVLFARVGLRRGEKLFDVLESAVWVIWGALVPARALALRKAPQCCPGCRSSDPAVQAHTLRRAAALGVILTSTFEHRIKNESVKHETSAAAECSVPPLTRPLCTSSVQASPSVQLCWRRPRGEGGAPDTTYMMVGGRGGPRAVAVRSSEMT